MSNIVAIVGRPNVGKSTLFNRLIEKRQAIMDDVSGVTRDRHYGYAEWTGHHFTVIDTGGYVAEDSDMFESAIKEQVKLALEEATVILFMLDCKTGLTAADKDFAKLLRAINKPILLVANKADNNNMSLQSAEFYALGMGEVHPISSTSGSGTGDLLDIVVSHFNEEVSNIDEENLPKIAILGQPNVGKSSFLNALLGEERTIVTDIAGTTRDTIHTRYTRFGKDFIITDTAGIRRKSRVKDNIEFYSVMRSLQALQNADVCVIMIDAEKGISAQDLNIMGLAERYNKGMLLMMNKWDIVQKDPYTADKLKKEIEEKISPLDYVPIMFTSVTKKQRIYQVVELALKIYENRAQKISTSKLNQFLLKDIEHYPPPAYKGKHIKIKYITQLTSKSPAFVFFCNLPQYIKKPYESYLKNQIRKHFDFSGVPIRVFFRKK